MMNKYMANALKESLMFLAQAAPVAPNPNSYIKYFATQ